MNLLRIAVFISLIQICFGIIAQDEVTSLPGWTGALPSRQFSGYIQVSEGRFLHYWFIYSQGNPSTDPVVLWLNGGPGCSSLDGMLYEMGPFHLSGNTSSSARPDLVINPNSWNLISNMIFLEAPAGVGYSYATTKNDLNTNDTQTALDNYAFLTKFFASYPEFAANDFYIFGESYAGIYVPTLSYTILTAPGNKVNLKGLGVGNGCFGSEVGACGPEGTQITIDYLYGHGLFSAKLYERIQQACPNPAQPSAACRVLLQEMSNQVGNVDVYNIYGPCINGPTSSELYNSDDFKTFKTHTSTSTSNNPLLNYPPENSELGGPNECIDSYLAYNYLNDPEVRKALHINITQTWVICTGAINYVSETKSLYPILPHLISNYRVLAYSGDADCCVPYTATEYWTSHLGIAEKEAWKPWTVDDQVAGYVTVYEATDFRFATIKGAGHMVPQTNGRQAFEMFSRFINKQPL